MGEKRVYSIYTCFIISKPLHPQLVQIKARSTQSHFLPCHTYRAEGTIMGLCIRSYRTLLPWEPGPGPPRPWHKESFNHWEPPQVRCSQPGRHPTYYCGWEMQLLWPPNQWLLRSSWPLTLRHAVRTQCHSCGTLGPGSCKVLLRPRVGSCCGWEYPTVVELAAPAKLSEFLQLRASSHRGELATYAN